MLSTEVGFDERSGTDDINRWAWIVYEKMHGLLYLIFPLCVPMVVRTQADCVVQFSRRKNMKTKLIL